MLRHGVLMVIRVTVKVGLITGNVAIIVLRNGGVVLMNAALIQTIAEELVIAELAVRHILAAITEHAVVTITTAEIQLPAKDLVVEGLAARIHRDVTGAEAVIVLATRVLIISACRVRVLL